MVERCRWTLLSLVFLAGCGGGGSSGGSSGHDAGAHDAGPDAKPACEIGARDCDCTPGGSCDPGLTCDSVTRTCQPPECPAGQTGCVCDQGHCADPDAACGGDGLCAVPECPHGAEGCPCADGACGFGNDGVALACGEDGLCARPDCAPGETGCACDGGACHAAGVACTDGHCTPTECMPGLTGCPCAGASDCDANQDQCDQGVCRPMGCPPGASGCACANGACADPMERCVDGTCQVQACPPGNEGCPCANGACAQGLACDDMNTCRDNTGGLGGHCFGDGTCRPGFDCQADLCLPCLRGSLGCACTPDDDGCGTGLACAGGTCVDASAQPPADQRCYTPCESGKVDAQTGRYVECPADKLMPGCVLEGFECRSGSCLRPGDPVPACDADDQCADWQTCIAGHCYSNCATDNDCGAGESCVRKVCRRACDVNHADCPDGSQCVSADGAVAYCVPAAPTGDQPDPATPGVIRVSRQSLSFTNVTNSQDFAIINDTDSFQTVTMRKLSHEVVSAAGAPERRADPDPTLPCDMDCDARRTEVRNRCLDDNGVDPMQFDALLQAAMGDEHTRLQRLGGACDHQASTDHDACIAGNLCPLQWLDIGPQGMTQRQQRAEIRVAPHDSVSVEVGNADGSFGVRWTGSLQLTTPGYPDVEIPLDYKQRPDGRWSGSMYYFAQFSTEGLDRWRSLPHGGERPPFAAGTRDADAERDRLRNALLQQWASFRAGRIGRREFEAILTSTRTESWSLPEIVQTCQDENNGARSARCFPFEGVRSGAKTYAIDQVATPIPSGVVELPLAMFIRSDDGDPHQITGKIDSATALHYAGEPGVSMRLDTDITSCSRNALGSCIVFFDVPSMQQPMARSELGGRYELDPDAGGCAGGFETKEVPWFPVGFERDTASDPQIGRVRRECRSTRAPFGAEALDLNRLLAASNPFVDGRTRWRELRIVDGAFIDNNLLFVIFEERFENYLAPNDPNGISSYGYAVLTRDAQRIDDTDADGDHVPDVYEAPARQPEPTNPPNVQLAPTCSPDVVRPILGVADPAAGTERLVLTLIDGVARSDEQAACIGEPGGPDRCLTQGEHVHYLCGDTGKFDDGGGADPVACPAGSDVVFFTVVEGGPVDPVRHACNGDGSCAAVLEDWRSNHRIVQYEPAWVCDDPNEALCSANRDDLRDGKVFFPVAGGPPVMTPLTSEVDRAFRYKTRFRNREGTNIGFAPALCVQGSDEVPYCYDPAAIEALRGRMDCLVAVWNDPRLYGALSASVKLRLMSALTESFAVGPVPRPADLPSADLRDGFERLYSELLVLLGDEAYTQAFSSRFDLAGIRRASFPGSRLEAGGVDLAGVAGAEMQLLYTAHEYYQEALDRFFRLAPIIWDAAKNQPADRDFVTLETVTDYVERLVNASTQKTRAASAIAQHYEEFDRPDLARAVIEREFTSAYIESATLSRIMTDIVDDVPTEQRAQIRTILEEVQRKYQAALLEMRDVHDSIAEGVNFFGFPPDYVPFPAIDVRETNAFENAYARAQQKLVLARNREDIAINSNRAFDTDSAEFQAELVRIRTTYESQLSDLCGSFDDPQGVPRPAIRKYAALVPEYALLGDPCGRLGNGQIFQAMGQVDVERLDLQQAIQRLKDTEAQIAIEKRALARQCGCVEGADGLVIDQGDEPTCGTVSDAIDRVTDFGDQQLSLNDDIRQDQFIIQTAQGVAEAAITIANAATAIASCSVESPGCYAVAGTAEGVISAAEAVSLSLAGVYGSEINDKQHQLEALQNEEAVWNIQRECQTADILSDQRVDTLHLTLLEQQIDVIREEYQVRLAMAQVDALRKKAQRLELEQTESEDLEINAEAARDDPNVRIYRNDAVINADVAFDAAIREAYRTTLIYEYYTSQSYAHKGDLFLTRLVARGDYNLENYLEDLNDAWFDFEEHNGLPNLRVLVLSLRDDIFRIPYVDEDGVPLTVDQRIGMMRDRIRNPALLDDHGYIDIPFDTRVEQVSPATRDHKIHHVEVSINANDAGDSVARLYLTQGGTSTVRSFGGDTEYYRFPPTTAVLNPYFSGNKGVFEPDVYVNTRLRDRPLLATDWRLIINQRDEQVNQDVNLQSLNDITLYIYYTDYTEL